ncbi:hypothetical protein BBK14_26995 [Parafrankia soli]|uniref:Uncharacterized protein n=1 Tax=Parafrankia soli TaxID=2599596 RepID=A0A1S1PEG3_9ACTN|nr:hypothetical protein [Parafrankia soli]OHV21293.1 hypothetical protein BBK14_26995 [Parafrankia soli]
MIGRLFPDEPGDDDTTADWSPPPGDPADGGLGTAGWTDPPEYPEIDPEETLTPDLDRALDAVLSSARLDPPPDDTWARLFATAYTSREPDGPEPSPLPGTRGAATAQERNDAMPDPDDDLDVEFPDGTTVINPDEDALGYVYETHDDYLHGNDPHEPEDLTPGYDDPGDADPGSTW